jgi:hypothetical protein
MDPSCTFCTNQLQKLILASKSGITLILCGQSLINYVPVNADASKTSVSCAA